VRAGQSSEIAGLTELSTLESFPRDLTLDDLRADLDPLVDKVWHYCESTDVRICTIPDGAVLVS
jgi:hypothetical protein